MTARSSLRDGAFEALVVDRYLESLLSRSTDPSAGVPHELAAAAERLVTDLPRYHPSFRFEEALAAQLAAVAARVPGDLIEFPTVARRSPAARSDRDPDRRWAGSSRPVVVGGVVTSALLSVAGAAYMTWRRRHAASGAMPRAVRAVARARSV